MERPRITARRRRGRRRALAVAVLLLGAAVAVYLLRRPVAPPPESIPPVAQEPQQPPTVLEAPAPLPSETLPPRDPSLPPLAESDPLARELASPLSRQPDLTEWLEREGVIRRVVAAVDNVADGLSPRAHLGSFAPSEEFRVIRRDGQVFLDPRSYLRYDHAADLFASLDPQGCAETYRRLQPLLEDAYRELGRPGQTFDAVLRAAIARLLATPVVEGEVELAPRVISYDFADPALEARSDAEKQFLRMGPRNVRRIQEHLRAIVAALGMPEAR